MEEEIEMNVSQEVVKLSFIEINGEFIDFRRLQEQDYRKTIPFGEAIWASFDSVSTESNYPLSLQLPHHLNDLSFHFSAVDWSAPHRVKYRFRLKGYDEGWSAPSSTGSVRYRDLPYGQYMFQIMAVVDNAEWSAPFEYSFRIRRAWWLSNMALCFYILVICSLTYLVLRIWNERKRQEAEIHRLLESYKLTDYPKAIQVERGTEESSFLRLVQNTLETHLSDENFGIAELCELLNISRTQLHRRLKKLTGLSTSHYIRSLRLEMAKNLLETTNYNISEVAFKVGFSSASYFSKVFKSQYGHAPRDHTMK